MPAEHIKWYGAEIPYLTRPPGRTSSRCRHIEDGAANPLREESGPMSTEESKAIVGRWFTEFWGISQ
ncbi:MAG: hypothetical protein J2P57_08565 [Acidimicrobiaceae bacterium]|nr:hypothetical protein [Acidimicrobiaceae bacterium]